MKHITRRILSLVLAVSLFTASCTKDVNDQPQQATQDRPTFELDVDQISDRFTASVYPYQRSKNTWIVVVYYFTGKQIELRFDIPAGQNVGIQKLSISEKFIRWEIKSSGFKP